MNFDNFNNVVSEFIDTIDLQFGIYLDASAGFQAIRERTIKHQLEFIEKLKEEDPDKANMEYLDSSSTFYGTGDPNDPKNIMWHATTHKQFKERTKKNGLNDKTVSRNCIILMYEFWETEYRKRASEALEITQKSLLIPIIGDLRLIRNAILHNKSRVTKDLQDKSEIIDGLKEGDEISFPDKMMYEIVHAIKSAMDDLVLKHTGQDPEHRTIWHVQ
jgi:hypothetical protein